MKLKNTSKGIINFAGRLIDPETAIYVNVDLLKKYQEAIYRYYETGKAVIVNVQNKELSLAEVEKIIKEGEASVIDTRDVKQPKNKTKEKEENGRSDIQNSRGNDNNRNEDKAKNQQDNMENKKDNKKDEGSVNRNDNRNGRNTQTLESEIEKNKEEQPEKELEPKPAVVESSKTTKKRRNSK